MSNTRKRSFGPGLIVAAAFIGPGTVTTCTLAGANFGYELMWALGFAVFATYVFQEMSGRIGIAGGIGLGEAINKELPEGIFRIAGMIMVVAAIGVGNSAYQAGNLAGASLGLSALTSTSVTIWPIILGIIAFILMFFGSYKTLEKFFIAFVGIMSLCFIFTAILVKPDIPAFIKGLFVPTVDKDNMYIALGLVGTTIAPYNLFLYSSIIRQKWKTEEEIPAARFDLLIAVLIGGAISMAIVTTASAAFFGTGKEIANAGDMALQLEPLLGSWAKAAVAIGLFGAGMTSSITAPLAAAYAITQAFNLKGGLKDTPFRLIWGVVLLSGVIVSSLGLSPVGVILFAQVSNGVLLPVVVLFLVYIMNNKRLLGESVNSLTQNIFSAIVIVVTLALGIRAILRAF